MSEYLVYKCPFNTYCCNEQEHVCGIFITRYIDLHFKLTSVLKLIRYLSGSFVFKGTLYTRGKSIRTNALNNATRDV